MTCTGYIIMTEMCTVNSSVIALAEKAFDNMDFEYAKVFVLGMARVKPDSETSKTLVDLVNGKVSAKSS